MRPLTSERTVTLEAVGRLWMPACYATTRRSFRVGKGPFEKDIECLDDAKALLVTETGDFSQVIDYEITYTTKRVSKNPDGPGFIHHTRTRVARPWQDQDKAFEIIDECHAGYDERD